MKNLLKLCLFSALLALPTYAQAAEAAKSATNCPMTGAMQKNMGAMIKDMNAMMASTSDPAMKTRMQNMQDKMGAMMANMRGGMMGDGMMSGGMMQGGKTQDSAPRAAPSAKPDDHAAHHPNQ